MNGMVNLWMNVDRKLWKKYICERIQKVGRKAWKGGFHETEMEKEYVMMKRCQRNESFTDENIGTTGRAGCLFIRGREKLA